MGWIIRIDFSEEGIELKAKRPYCYITTVKSGKHYVIFDYKDASGKRKRKWVSTGLLEKCTKKALSMAIQKVVKEFEQSITEGSVVIYKCFAGCCYRSESILF